MFFRRVTRFSRLMVNQARRQLSSVPAVIQSQPGQNKTVTFPITLKSHVSKCRESTLGLPPTIVLKSELDSSLNIKKRFGDAYLETRAVVRDSSALVGNKLCLYVSSHNGCNMGCQQCWLSHEGLTAMKPVDSKQFAAQITHIIEEFVRHRPFAAEQITRVTVEFMARGEPLWNRDLVYNYTETHRQMREAFQQSPIYEKVHRNRLFLKDVKEPMFKMHISTIFPQAWWLPKYLQAKARQGDPRYNADDFLAVKKHRPLDLFFMHPTNEDLDKQIDSWPIFYHSAWYLRESVRQKMMPSAMPIELAMALLGEYQKNIRRRLTKCQGFTDIQADAVAKQKVVIHRAFVDGLNDSMEEAQDLLACMKRHDVQARINTLRFSRPENLQHNETPDPHRSQVLQFLHKNNPMGLKEIGRAGEDVSASCGVFTKGSQITTLPPSLKSF